MFARNSALMVFHLRRRGGERSTALLRGPAPKGLRALRRLAHGCGRGPLALVSNSHMASLLSHRTGRPDEHASPEEAVSAFIANGWRERLIATLANGFERRLGRAAVADAVDHALTRALTELRP